ncbi:MAG: DUF4115 domain-containing protein [Pelagimonas sp.]|jgi:cytoskeletal protein RodZ|nr:DUF4115 domain-containing protein [Pelagimonas sp.]
MIGRNSKGKNDAQDTSQRQGFDDFTMKLGDMMRGERATMGKSLLDVHRELRIKASYIAAIENCDPSEFDTPSFIAGYVRSYARYLGMDPDEAFAAFCRESGFEVAHGMAREASGVRKPTPKSIDTDRDGAGPLSMPNLPYAPAANGFFSRIEPGAVGSSLVLLALIAGIGYGGWSVLQEIQRVQVAPVDQTPVVLSQLDPLTAAMRTDQTDGPDAAVSVRPSSEAFDRLYRPQALDVPVLVSRDAPISTLDPASVGVFSQQASVAADVVAPEVQDSIDAAVAMALVNETTDRDGVSFAAAPQIPGLDSPTLDVATPVAPVVGAPQVLENPVPGITIVATAETWVEVTAPSGKKLLAQTMQAGDTYRVPATEQPPTIFSGNAGGVYFAVNGQTFGPYGQSGQFGRNLALDANSISDQMQVADLTQNQTLAKTVAELSLRNTNP